MRIEPSAGESFAKSAGGGFPPGSGPSFAELLEDGQSAKAIIAHRALRFSDVGVLGVHGTLGDPAGDAGGTGGAGCVLSDPVGLAGQAGLRRADLRYQGKNAPNSIPPIQTTDAASALPALRFDREGVPGERGEAGLRTRCDIVPQGLSPGLAIPISYSGRAGRQVPMEAESSPGTPPESALMRIAYLPGGRTVRIHLVSTPEGMMAIAEGFALEPQESASIDNLARSVAADFGVTIRRVVIRRNRG